MIYDNREILIIDHSNCKESEMIERLGELAKLIQRENKPILLLAIFNEKSYATPRFMREAEKESKAYLHLIDKQAVMGVSGVKKWILKGYNLLFNRDIRNFDTIDDAIKFLVDENTSDKNRS